MIVESTNIDDLDITSSKLSSVSVTVIQKLVKKMKRLVMRHCRLTEDQKNMLFKTISGGSQLVELDVDNINLSNLDLELFKFVTRLKKLDFCNCNLSPDQIDVMLESIRDASDEDMKLEHLDLTMNHLTPIHFGLFGDSLSRLESVELWGCNPLLQGLFNHLLTTDQPRLKHLNIGFSDLMLYDPPTVANSLSKLESVNMSQCNVPPMIVTMLATNLQSGSSALKTIRLGGVDVSEDCKKIFQDSLQTFDCSMSFL